MRRLLAAVALTLLVVPSAYADRYYGNVNLTYTRQFDTDGIPGYSYQQQQLALSYEDALFYKNRMRLGLNMYRTQRERTSRYDLRPIYSVDISSYGYSVRYSFSPYKRENSESLGEFQRLVYDIYTRESRIGVSLLYPKWPGVNVAYSTSRNFDKQPVRRIDTQNRNLLAQAGYGLGPISASLSYNRVVQDNRLPGATDRTLESFTAATNVTRDLAGWATVAAGYSYYDNQSEVPSSARSTQNSHAQSVTLFASSRRFYNLSAYASYSGRFFTSSTLVNQFGNSSQTMAAQVGYYPASYASLELLKSYQISDESGTYRPLEYISFISNFTRYLRRGVNTRLSFSRLVYQQNVGGEPDGAASVSGRTVDTYYGSLGFKVLRGVKLLLDVSTSHVNRPLDPDLRYQIQRMLVAQFALSSTLEGRATGNWTYAGADFRPFSSYSLNYNFGLTWTPNTALNATLSYNYQAIRTGDEQKYGNLAGYIGYSFRRAFALSVAVNQQYQERTIVSPENLTELWKTEPRSLNSTLTIYLSKNINGTVGYSLTSSPRLSGDDLRTENLTANTNIRF